MGRGLGEDGGMSSFLVAAALAFLPGIVAPPISDSPVAVNLDRDPEMERLEYHQRSSDFLVQAQVHDRCRGGRRTWRLSPYENKFNAIYAIEADRTTPQPEVFFAATGDSEALTDRLVKLVRFEQPDGACARPHTIFRYRPHPARNGRGTSVIGARVTDAIPSRPGREIRLRLGTFDRSTGEARLVRRLTRIYGYATRLDRYVEVDAG
jgi:hypothetical protein